MTKAQLRALKKALASAQQRARSTAQDGERLWLHTWIIPRLEAVIGPAEGRMTEVEADAQEADADPDDFICPRSKR